MMCANKPRNQLNAMQMVNQSICRKIRLTWTYELFSLLFGNGLLHILLSAGQKSSFCKKQAESHNSRAAPKDDRDLEMHDTSNADSPPIIFAGKSLSILDGILLAVKDDVDCLPHPSTGTFSLLQILDVRPKIQFQVLIVGRCVWHVSQFLLVCLCQLEQNGWPKCEKWRMMQFVLQGWDSVVW